MDLEKYFDVSDIKGRYQQAIAPETAKALISFCGQEKEFEQAVEQSGKTFQECLDTVVKGIGRSISDIDVYRKAVQFYFEGAEVQFIMKINLYGNSEAPPITVRKGGKKSALNLSFDSLLDF